MTIREVQKEMKSMIGRTYSDLSELCDAIYVAFGDYTYEEEEHVIADFSTSGEVRAYIDHIDAPMFYVYYNAKMDKDGYIETVTVTGVELYER